MLHDPTFWVAAGVVIFIALMVKPVGRMLGTGLDKRSERIKFELDEAIRLKEEAQALLASYQSKQQQAMQESEDIVAHAKKEADRIVHDAKTQLEQDIQKRTELALAKIEHAEVQVIQEIRNNAVDITIGAARSLIVEHLGSDAAEQIMASAISDIDRKFH